MICNIVINTKHNAVCSVSRQYMYIYVLGFEYTLLHNRLIDLVEYIRFNVHCLTKALSLSDTDGVATTALSLIIHFLYVAANF